MPENSLIRRLHYNSDRQNAFSDLSGDYNPIHDDPVAARRTLVGAQTVHGIHHLLVGMEALLEHLAKSGQPANGISRFSVQFLKPVLVGDTVDFYLTLASQNECLIVARIDDEIMCQFSVHLGAAAPGAVEKLLPPHRDAARELGFGDLSGMRGAIALELDAVKAQSLFPRLTATVGLLGLAEILALTRLVGMHCPGLHSLFSQAAAAWEDNGAAGVMTYEVEQTDERFGKVLIAVRGPRLRGRLTAFLRPPPESQPPMDEIARLVKPDAFGSSVALIVGGSRGLGEITGKIIAAGGGRPIVTYHQGADDAERLAREIRSWGGRCEILQFDVRKGEGALQKLFDREATLTTLYYFATPKIGLRRGFFSHEMLARYNEYYSTAFGRLMDAAASRAKSKLRVFYPSTVFVEENPREMAEYVISKRAAEELCAFYNRYSKNIQIVVERLPRMKTDQTSSLLPVETQDSLDVMLPIVQKMETAG